MPFNVTIFTLFPEAFPATLGVSIHGRALNEGIWNLHVVDLRPFGDGKHLKVDDTPSGGGAGLVMRADVLLKAFDAHIAADDARPRYMLSPRGEVLTQAKAQEFGAQSGIILICGRYEGVDQRFLDARNIGELSIGDYVLSGGEVAALVVLEAVIRLLPGVMGKAESAVEESHSAGLLEYPQYTRPAVVEGLHIPEVLQNGDHGRIAEWRQQQAEALTQARRPDLWAKYKNILLP